MTRVYLIRHAEAEGNVYRRIHGQYDSLITPNGWRQIKALEERFRDIPVTAVYSSDLFRTRATAGAVCRAWQLPLNTDPRLREVNMGVWEDETWAAMARRDAEQMQLFNQADPRWQVEGGERFLQVQARATDAILELAAQHPEESIAVVSHGMVIRAVISGFYGYDISEMKRIPHCENTAVSCIQVENGRGEILFLGDSSHLTEEISTFARQNWWRDQENGSVTVPDANLWYRPWDPDAEAALYYGFRKDAWVDIHGSLLYFEGEEFLRAAVEQAAFDPRSVWVVMCGDDIAGLLQLDIRRDADKKIGGIPFFYLRSEYRRQGLGIQLLGQAVSVYRPLGREWLRLRCAPDNYTAQRFYRRNGFCKVGEAADSRVPLDLLDKYIGFDMEQHRKMVLENV